MNKYLKIILTWLSFFIVLFAGSYFGIFTLDFEDYYPSLKWAGCPLFITGFFLLVGTGGIGIFLLILEF